MNERPYYGVIAFEVGFDMPSFEVGHPMCVARMNISGVTRVFPYNVYFGNLMFNIYPLLLRCPVVLLSMDTAINISIIYLIIGWSKSPKIVTFA